MRSEEREVKGEKMSTQELAPKRPRIGKLMLIAAIAVSSLTLLLLLLAEITQHLFFPLDFYLLPLGLARGAAILSLLLFCAAAIFYLIREEQAVAARVWGILGGLPLAYSSLLFVGAIPPFVFPFIMAIGGGVLALRRPKLAGVLMLAGAAGTVVVFLVVIAVPGAEYIATFLLALCLLVSSFLIPGGILALTSHKGQGASKKMVVVAIAAFF